MRGGFLGAFDRSLHKSVQAINKADSVVEQIVHDPLPVFEPEKPQMTNRTGLRDALAILKEKAKAARQRSMEAGEKANEAFSKQEAATESLNKYADEVIREADDVMAELGQFSNGGPE